MYRKKIVSILKLLCPYDEFLGFPRESTQLSYEQVNVTKNF